MSTPSAGRTANTSSSVSKVIQARQAAREAGLDYSDDSGSDFQDSGSETQERGLLLSQRRKKRKTASRKRLDYAARRRTLTLEERLEEERTVQEAFDSSLLKLQEVDRAIEEAALHNNGHNDGNEVPESLHLEWLDLASYLIDTFRTTKGLFPSDGKKKYLGGFRKSYKRRNKKVKDGQNVAEEEEEEPDVDDQAAGIAERLHASLADDDMQFEEPDSNVEHNAYRGVTFDDWAGLTVRVSLDFCPVISVILIDPP
jgi:general transcription factor 3C polypeptide 3 (transcription factor C subunit 4)